MTKMFAVEWRRFVGFVWTWFCLWDVLFRNWMRWGCICPLAGTTMEWIGVAMVRSGWRWVEGSWILCGKTVWDFGFGKNNPWFGWLTTKITLEFVDWLQVLKVFQYTTCTDCRHRVVYCQSPLHNFQLQTYNSIPYLENLVQFVVLFYSHSTCLAFSRLSVVEDFSLSPFTAWPCDKWTTIFRTGRHAYWHSLLAQPKLFNGDIAILWVAPWSCTSQHCWCGNRQRHAMAFGLGTMSISQVTKKITDERNLR